jgi:hypothetical protein
VIALHIHGAGIRTRSAMDIPLIPADGLIQGAPSRRPFRHRGVELFVDEGTVNAVEGEATSLSRRIHAQAEITPKQLNKREFTPADAPRRRYHHAASIRVRYAPCQVMMAASGLAG